MRLPAHAAAGTVPAHTEPMVLHENGQLCEMKCAKRASRARPQRQGTPGYCSRPLALPTGERVTQPRAGAGALPDCGAAVLAVQQSLAACKAAPHFKAHRHTVSQETQ